MLQAMGKLAPRLLPAAAATCTPLLRLCSGLHTTSASQGERDQPFYCSATDALSSRIRPVTGLAVDSAQF